MEINEQLLVCQKYGADLVPCLDSLKVGISMNVKSGVYPINGLRHLPVGDTSGWYIWVGEFSTDEDFFEPLHISHIDNWNPLIRKYLGLAPGWRFLITPTYEDVWEDLTLLVQ